MIRLKQCIKNPYHWYSDHAYECPWCRMFQEQSKDSFPPPGQAQVPPLISYKNPIIPSPSPMRKQILGNPRKLIAGFLIVGLLVAVIFVAVSVGKTQGSSVPQVSPTFQSPTPQVSPTPHISYTPTPSGTFSSKTSSQPFIHIDPVGNRRVGETFTITATTNLAVGDAVLFEIASSSFRPSNSAHREKFSGALSTGNVMKGDEEGLNIVSYDLDTSTFEPDEYIIKATAVTKDAMDTARFNIVN